MALKVKFRTVFPALVEVESPIVLVKAGSVYTFSIDVDALEATFGALFQPIDETLIALASLNSTAGLLTQTGADAFTKRTLTGTANEITVTNGDGAAGAPTLSLPAAMTLTGKTMTGGTFTGGLWNKVTITAPATAATLTLIDGTTLTGPASSGTVMTLGNTETVTGVKTFGSAGAVGRLRVAGTTSGSTIIDATAVASGTLTLPAATDTLVGKATTDTLINKTINTASGNSIFVNSVLVGPGQYLGEPSTGNAVAGNIGELISATIVAGSAVSLSTGSGITITSIVLTAGDWDISAQACVTGNASTTFTGVRASLSTTIATENTVAPFFNAQSFNAFALLGTFDYGCAISPIRVSISGSTTYYLIIRANFATSTCSGYGSIRARRVR